MKEVVNESAVLLHNFPNFREIGLSSSLDH